MTGAWYDVECCCGTSQLIEAESIHWWIHVYQDKCLDGYCDPQRWPIATPRAAIVIEQFLLIDGHTLKYTITAFRLISPYQYPPMWIRWIVFAALVNFMYLLFIINCDNMSLANLLSFVSVPLSHLHASLITLLFFQGCPKLILFLLFGFNTLLGTF